MKTGMLDERELDVWTRRRENTARPYREEVMAERRGKLGVEEIRGRLDARQTPTCECSQCLWLRELVKEIDAR